MGGFHQGYEAFVGDWRSALGFGQERARTGEETSQLVLNMTDCSLQGDRLERELREHRIGDEMALDRLEQSLGNQQQRH